MQCLKFHPFLPWRRILGPRKRWSRFHPRRSKTGLYQKCRVGIYHLFYLTSVCIREEVGIKLLCKVKMLLRKFYCCITRKKFIFSDLIKKFPLLLPPPFKKNRKVIYQIFCNNFKNCQVFQFLIKSKSYVTKHFEWNYNKL